MDDSAFEQKIVDAIGHRDFAEVREAFAGSLPAEIAVVINGLEAEDRAITFRLLPREMASDTFEYLEPDVQEGLIKALAHEHVASILNEMSPDDRTALLEELPAAVTRQALAMLSVEERTVARKLLGYPEESIGRLMTPDFISVFSDWTVQQALEHIRIYGHDSETLNMIYVVDEQGKLLADLRMRRLLLADLQSPISGLIEGKFIALKATEDQEEAVRVFAEYDRVAFPVTDSRGVLLGIVTVDDVLDVAEEEATEDIQKIGGMQALDQPYMQVAFVEMLRKRAGWLVALFFGQLLTTYVMGAFIEQIEKLVVLVLFVPLIISSGGNAGSQAATLVIRAIALEQVDIRDWWRVMRREFLFGLTVGLVLASIGLMRIAVGSHFGEDFHQRAGLVMVVVGLSLNIAVLWGAMVGSMLPFALRRIGVDPAASSTPLVATVSDITGILIYLSIANALL